MKFLSNILAVIVAMTLIGIIIYAGYYGAKYVWDIYFELDYAVRVILLTFIITILISAIAISSAIKVAGRSASNNHIKARKIDFYKTLIQYYNHLITDRFYFDAKVGELDTNVKQELKTDLLLIASKLVIDACKQLDDMLDDTKDNAESVSKCFDRLIKNIRCDLGHNNTYEDISFIFIMNKRQAVVDSNSSDEHNKPVYN